MSRQLLAVAFVCVYSIAQRDRWLYADAKVSFDLTADEPYQVKSNAFNQCDGEVCYAQGECCSGAICVKHLGDNMGHCEYLTSQPEGALCVPSARPPSCARGLHCKMTDDTTQLGVCINTNVKYEPAGVGVKCGETLDCDLDEGLCCRSQMHGRAAQSTQCDYYEDLITDCIFK